MTSKEYRGKASSMLISSQYGSEEHIYRDRAEELVDDLIDDLAAAEAERDEWEAAYKQATKCRDRIVEEAHKNCDAMQVERDRLREELADYRAYYEIMQGPLGDSRHLRVRTAIKRIEARKEAAGGEAK